MPPTAQARAFVGRHFLGIGGLRQVQPHGYESAERSPSFKLDNLRALLDEQQAAHWHEVKATLLGTLGSQRHRASADARLLQQTFLAVQAWRTAEA